MNLHQLIINFQTVIMDLFPQIEPQDYNLEELVLPPHPTSKHMIDYRVKLLLKHDITLNPGDSMLAKTTCIIRNGVDDFCLHIKKSENIPLTLLSEGYISEMFTGRVLLKLANYKSDTIKLCEGTEVGFVIVNTFSLN